MDTSDIVLQAFGITKRFPGVLANSEINLTLRKGEILALLGENGAGKSTLMNILYGLYHPDEGEIWIKGEQVRLRSPHDAIARGIGMVHQHFQLVPVMTVAENVMLGSEVTGFGGKLNTRAAEFRVRDLSQQYGLEVNPSAIVEDLPVGIQQRVEIIKALYRDAEVLILDEPTAVLTPQEADDLFKVMRRLADRGVSIIFITHKLREVLAIADRIVVLRRGKEAGTITPDQATRETLAQMMVGREVLLQVRKQDARPAQPVLEVRNLTVTDDRKHPAVNNVSFDVRAGEIVGIAGVQGNGQTELAEAITRLREIKSGHVVILGQDVTQASPRLVTALGMGHIPEDRHRHGLVLTYPIKDNLILADYYEAPYSKGWVLDESNIAQNARKLVEQYDVRTPSIYALASELSGGNQQKVIVARELARQPHLLLANQPTRGLDVGSIEFIHNQIVAARDAGAGVLLVSAELDEIMSLSDRILVMYHGQIMADVPADQATREQLGLLMAGVESEEAVALERR